MPKTDFSYQAASLSDIGSRCIGPRRPSIRAISQNYFNHEAGNHFITEALFFGVMVVTAALPIISTVRALMQLSRSTGAI